MKIIEVVVEGHMCRLKENIGVRGKRKGKYCYKVDLKGRNLLAYKDKKKFYFLKLKDSIHSDEDYMCIDYNKAE